MISRLIPFNCRFCDRDVLGMSAMLLVYVRLPRSSPGVHR